MNPEISEIEAIEMLAQHIITKPVFDSLFNNNDFTKDNPISIAIDKVIKEVYKQNLEIESET